MRPGIPRIRDKPGKQAVFNGEVAIADGHQRSSAGAEIASDRFYERDATPSPRQDCARVPSIATNSGHGAEGRRKSLSRDPIRVAVSAAFSRCT
jgi:hypothetical protein